MTDPLSVFYENRPSYLQGLYGRKSIVLADPQSLAGDALQRAALGAAAPAAATEAPSMAEAMGVNGVQNQPAPINLRSDFNPLATFAPTVRTGSKGEARVFIKLPGNLTRYRVMVVAGMKGAASLAWASQPLQPACR